MHSFWRAFTALGDSGFLLPTAALILFWLFVHTGTRKASLQWALLFGGCGLVVMASKLAFMGWGVGSAALNFTGFSGHTALSTSVWPVLMWVAAARAPGRWRLAAAWLGWCLALGIGVSRLALEAHSNSEVIAGALLGTAVSAGFLRLQWGQGSARRGRRWPLVAVVLLMALLLQGRPAPTQDALELIAAKLAKRERVYTREDLLARTAGPTS